MSWLKPPSRLKRQFKRLSAGAIADTFSPLLWGNAQDERGIISPLAIALKGRCLNALVLTMILTTDG
ncbi:MAG: hypothetical protein WBA99_19675, partial [Nodosilinea sp.]